MAGKLTLVDGNGYGASLKTTDGSADRDITIPDALYSQTEVDNLVDNAGSIEAGVLRNGPIHDGVLALDTVSEVGSKPVLYTGNGTSQDVTTPMDIANHNGQTGLATIAADWAYSAADDYDDWNGTGTTKASFAIDNSATGDARVYENITGVNTTSSPVIDTTNWVLAEEQLGGRFHFKNRDATDDHKVFDSIRRELKNIETNTTAIEASLANSLTAINVASLSVGSDVTVNTNAEDYVVWVDQTTRKTAGYRTDAGVIQNSKNNTATDLLEVDSVGGFVIEHYNPTTGFGIVMDVGDGVAGRDIPISCQKKPFFFVKKKLTTTPENWNTYDKVNTATKYMLLNTTVIATAATTLWNDTEPTEDKFTVGTSNGVNTSGEQFITYYQCETDNHKFKAYTGTGAVGNEVDLGLDMTEAGSWCRIKSYVGGIGNWTIVDNIRGDAVSLLADSSSAEGAVTAFDFTATGITVNATGISQNASGYLYIIEAYSPTYNKPTGGNLIGVNTDKDITYTKGVGITNALETTSAHTVDCSALAGETAYIVRENGVGTTAELTTIPAYTERPSGYTDVYLNTTDNKVYNGSDVAKELVVLGECKVDGQGLVFDLVEYRPNISYFDEVVATGDVKTLGKFVGENACTAFVNFDATTTPVTVHSSFNVSDVIKTAAGYFEIFFEDDMDSIAYTPTVTHGDINASANGIQYNRSAFKKSKFSVRTTIYSTGSVNPTSVTVDIKGGKN